MYHRSALAVGAIFAYAAAQQEMPEAAGQDLRELQATCRALAYNNNGNPNA